MLARTMDAGFLNTVANHPEVRPHVGGDGEIDLSELLASPMNVALANENGGFLFVGVEPGRYELHTMFLPQGRGAQVLKAAAFAFRWMFVETDCAEIITKVPEPNRPAALMAAHAGFRKLFRRSDAWGPGQAVDYLVLPLEEWIGNDPTLAGAGHAFHELLEAAKAATGSELPTHPDDEAHDRAAGAAALMAKAGNGAKAVWTYNRWARFAGYQTIELLSAAPLVVDVRDALVGARNGTLEVLKCR